MILSQEPSAFAARLNRKFTLTFPGTTPDLQTNGPGGSVWIAVARSETGIMNIAAPDLNAHLAFRLSQPGQSPIRYDVVGLPLPPWALYVAAVGWSWAARGYEVPGLDAVILAEEGVREGFVWETGLAFAAAWQDLGGWPAPSDGLLGVMARLGGYFH